jgi:hypothetical protein
MSGKKIETIDDEVEEFPVISALADMHMIELGRSIYVSNTSNDKLMYFIALELIENLQQWIVPTELSVKKRLIF